MSIDRKQYELVNDSGDSANTVHDIDTNVYAETSWPRGYERQASVEEHVCPADCDSNAP